MPLRFARLDTLAEAAEAAAAEAATAATTTAGANGGAVAADYLNATAKHANDDDDEDDDTVEDVAVVVGAPALTAASTTAEAAAAAAAAIDAAAAPKRLDTKSSANSRAKQQPKQRPDRRRNRRPFSIRANKAAAAAEFASTVATKMFPTKRTFAASTNSTSTKSITDPKSNAAVSRAALPHSQSQQPQPPLSNQTTQLPQLQQCQFDDLERLLYQRQSQLLSGKIYTKTTTTSSLSLSAFVGAVETAAVAPVAAAPTAAPDAATTINGGSSSNRTIATKTRDTVTNINSIVNVDTNSVNVMHELVRASNHRRALMRQACQSFLAQTSQSSQSTILPELPQPLQLPTMTFKTSNMVDIQQQPIVATTTAPAVSTTARTSITATTAELPSPPRRPEKAACRHGLALHCRDDNGTAAMAALEHKAPTQQSFSTTMPTTTATAETVRVVVPTNTATTRTTTGATERLNQDGDYSTEPEPTTDSDSAGTNASFTPKTAEAVHHKQPASPSRPLAHASFLLQSLQLNDIVLVGAAHMTTTTTTTLPAATTAATASISENGSALTEHDQTDATAATVTAQATTAPTRRQPLRLPPHDTAWTWHFRETIDYYWNLQAQCVEQPHRSNVVTTTATAAANAREVAAKAVEALVTQGARFVAPTLGPTDVQQDDATLPSSLYVALTQTEAVNAVTLLIQQLACRQAQRRLAAGWRDGDIVVPACNWDRDTDTKATARVGHDQLHALFMLHRDEYCRVNTTRVQRLAICSSILQALQRAGRRLVTACPIQRRFVAVQCNAQAILMLQEMMDRAINQVRKPDSTMAAAAGPPLPPPLTPICNDHLGRTSTCESSSVAPRSPPTMPAQRQRCLDSMSPNSSNGISSPANQRQRVNTSSFKHFNASFSPARRKRASKLFDDNVHAVDMRNMDHGAEIRNAKRLRLNEAVATRAITVATAKASTVTAAVLTPLVHNEEYDDDETELEDNGTNDTSDGCDSDQDLDKHDAELDKDDDSTVLEDDFVDAKAIHPPPAVQAASANLKQCQNGVGVNAAVTHSDHAPLNASSGRFLSKPTAKTPHMPLPQQQQQQPVAATLLQQPQQQLWRHCSTTVPTATIATSNSSALLSPNVAVSSSSALQQNSDGQTTLTQLTVIDSPLPLEQQQQKQSQLSPNETADARLNSWIHEATNFVLGGVAH